MVAATVVALAAVSARAEVGPGEVGIQAQRLDSQPRTLTVVAGGDILFEGRIGRLAREHAGPGVRYDTKPFFAPIRSIVEWADLAICHMETPIDPAGGRAGWVGRGAYGSNLIVAPWEMAFDLRAVGFDRCSTASNHAYDTGLAGITSTLDAFDAAGISHTGTARTPAEAQPQVFTVNGVKVGHISYARNSNVGWPADTWRLNRAVNAQAMIADATALRAAGAEVVIVSLHVYVEMQKAPTADDRALVNALTSAVPVDLVVIHGPHVVQHVERVNGAVVYWSVGNLLSAMGLPDRGKYSDARALDGLLATVRFTEQPGGGWLAEPWTVLVCNELQQRVIHPAVTALADPATPVWLRGELQRCLNRSASVVADLR